jgi:hypothetical protein
MFIAKVDTYYTTYALGKTEAEAKRLALRSAFKYLTERGAEADPGKPYTTQKQVEEYLGCSVWEIEPGTAIQEY